MMLVNVERGREEGNALARKLEEISRERDPFRVGEERRRSTLSQEVQNDLAESFSYQRS
jgi:MFS transporter, UMF1 family